MIISITYYVLLFANSTVLPPYICIYFRSAKIPFPVLFD